VHLRRHAGHAGVAEEQRPQAPQVGVHCRRVGGQRGGGIACGDQPAGGADSDGCFEDAADCAGNF
jgi:hypothetical protein